MEISCVTYELASIRENYEIAKEKRKQNYQPGKKREGKKDDCWV